MRAQYRLTVAGMFLVACQCAGLAVVIVALKWGRVSPLGDALSSPMGLVLVAFVLSGGMSLFAPVLHALGIRVARQDIAPPLEPDSAVDPLSS